MRLDPLNDPVDDLIDDVIDLIDRAGKALFPYFIGVVIGIALGYAWRMAQTGAW